MARKKSPTLLPKTSNLQLIRLETEDNSIIAVVAAIYAPNMPVNVFIFGEFALKWVVLALFILSTVIDISVNTGGKVAHLGGAVLGIIYGAQLRKGNDLMDFFSFKRRTAKVVKMKNTRKAENDSEEKTLNEILDKINRSGYESLSANEKHVLQKIASKK